MNNGRNYYSHNRTVDKVMQFEKTRLLHYDLGSLYEQNYGALGPKQPLVRLGLGCEAVAKVAAGLVSTVLSLSTIL